MAKHFYNQCFGYRFFVVRRLGVGRNADFPFADRTFADRHLLSGLLLTGLGHLLTQTFADFSQPSICWFYLDICWPRHLLIFPVSAYRDICWSRHLLILSKEWFTDLFSLKNFFPAFFTLISGKFCSFSSIFLPYYINVPSIFDQICEFSANFIKNCFKISFSPQNFITKTGFRCSKFIYVEFFYLNSQVDSNILFCFVYSINGPWFSYFFKAFLALSFLPIVQKIWSAILSKKLRYVGKKNYVNKFGPSEASLCKWNFL